MMGLRLLAHRTLGLSQARALRYRCLVHATSTSSAATAAVEVERGASAAVERLRDYQSEAVEEVLRGWQSGYHRQIVSMATGAGKTFTFCFLASVLQRKTLIIVHRSELVQQTVRALADMGHVEDVGVLHGKTKQFNKRILVATVQSACQEKTLDLLAQEDFQLCIVDEAHHATAATWLMVMLHMGFVTQDIVEKVTSAGRAQEGREGQDGGSPSPSSSTNKDSSYLGAETTSESIVEPATETVFSSLDSLSLPSPSDGDGGMASPWASVSDPDEEVLQEVQFQGHTFRLPVSQKLLLGVTATPYRSDDRRSLRQLFQKQAFEIGIGTLIDSGYLCPVTAHRIMTYTDISKVKIHRKHKAGDEDGTDDFSTAELSRVVNTDDRNKLVVQSYLEVGESRKAIAFCCDVAHAEALAAMFRDCGVAADCVTNKSGDMRKPIVEAFKNGEIKVLCNVSILTEGWDEPSLGCVMMTRPTKSSGLYTQCVGRGLRKYPGKENCLILDFTDRTHSLDKESELISCGMMFEEGPGVQLVGYGKPPTPRVEPQIKLVLQGGLIKLYSSKDMKLRWTPLGRDLWLHVTDWLAYKRRQGKSGIRRYLSTGNGNGKWVYYKHPTTVISLMPKVEDEPRRAGVWVHLQRVGVTESKGKRTALSLEYKLRIARETMHMVDSDQWIEFPLKATATQSDAGQLEQREVVEQFMPPPAKIVTAAERMLARFASAMEHGLTPEMLEGSKDTRRDAMKNAWTRDSITPAQRAKLMTFDWIFADCREVDNLTKGEASTMLELGSLYDEYCKANNIKQTQHKQADLEDEAEDGAGMRRKRRTAIRNTQLH